jgi:hypothetical protein
MDQSSEIIECILTGQADEDLAGITAAVNERKREMSFKTASRLKKNDKIRVCGNISPKYLIGLIGTIAGEIRGARIPVTLGPEAGRYAGTASMPIACIEPIE